MWRRKVGRVLGIAMLFSCAPLGDQGEAADTAPFLVTTADSAFLVEMAGGQWRIRRSAMLIGRTGGRFVELFVHDDDRSFRDALIVGQQIFRRDLITGDSIALSSDTIVAAVARDYARLHPDDRPLLPDEETAEDPEVVATTETELLGLAGPFLSYEYHGDIELGGERDHHVTARRVVDIGSGLEMRIADIAAADEVAEIFSRAEAAFAAIRDSVRRAEDSRGRRAQAAFPGFTFDSLSFSVVTEGAELSVGFLVPGRGVRAGGLALPLPPLEIRGGPWREAYDELRPETHGADGSRWRDDASEVIARPVADRAATDLIVRRGSHEWSAGRVGGVVERVHLLSLGDSSRTALIRAFDEAQLYSGETRLASLRIRPPSRMQRSVVTRRREGAGGGQTFLATLLVRYETM
jgi:hypothetical protein